MQKQVTIKQLVTIDYARSKEAINAVLAHNLEIYNHVTDSCRVS